MNQLLVFAVLFGKSRSKVYFNVGAFLMIRLLIQLNALTAIKDVARGLASLRD
jgi:hypothetical protein